MTGFGRRASKRSRIVSLRSFLRRKIYNRHCMFTGNKRSQHLRPPRTLYGRKSRQVMQRYPLRYWPRSSTTLNWERLPPPEELADMQLAYREQPLDERSLALATLLIFLLLALLAALASLFISLVEPFYHP